MFYYCVHCDDILENLTGNFECSVTESLETILFKCIECGIYITDDQMKTGKTKQEIENYDK